MRGLMFVFARDKRTSGRAITVVSGGLAEPASRSIASAAAMTAGQRTCSCTEGGSTAVISNELLVLQFGWLVLRPAAAAAAGSVLRQFFNSAASFDAHCLGVVSS